MRPGCPSPAFSDQYSPMIARPCTRRNTSALGVPDGGLSGDSVWLLAMDGASKAPLAVHRKTHVKIFLHRGAHQTTALALTSRVSMTTRRFWRLDAWLAAVRPTTSVVV